MLAELQRRCTLPDGDPNKLRFEPASREDQLNAARNPESVHPTPHFLPVLKAKAAEAAARRAARDGAAARARSYHPRNMQYVGRLSTSMSNIPRSQRRDTGGRRPRASDTDPRVRRRRPMRGITSMAFVLPGTDGTSRGGDGEPAAKRQRVGEYALDDRITQFELSPEFDDELVELPCSSVRSSRGLDGRAVVSMTRRPLTVRLSRWSDDRWLSGCLGVHTTAYVRSYGCPDHRIFGILSREGHTSCASYTHSMDYLTYHIRTFFCDLYILVLCHPYICFWYVLRCFRLF